MYCLFCCFYRALAYSTQDAEVGLLGYRAPKIVQMSIMCPSKTSFLEGIIKNNEKTAENSDEVAFRRANPLKN